MLVNFYKLLFQISAGELEDGELRNLFLSSHTILIEKV